MADEKTTNNGSQEAKDKEIEELKSAKEKADKRVENAEKKFSEWSNELGEIRKQKEELEKTLINAKKTILELEDVVSNDGTKAAKGDVTGEKADETAETVEKSLSESQRKVGEEAFNTLSNAEKLQYENDAKFRLSFLKRLQEVEPVIPTSPWKTAPKKKDDETSGIKSILDRVFTKKKQASYVPSGSQSGSPVLGASKNVNRNEPPEDSRVH